MNYRHAFHAGNFADVMKHALLVRILAYLQRKETPLRVIDTHAGIGLYDLAGDEAGRTGEWIEGIGRLEEPFAPEVEELLAPYRTVLADVRARHGRQIYPGSPGILREILRRQDRGVLVELHPADHAVLSRALQRGHQPQGDASRRLDRAPRADPAEGKARPRPDRPALRGAERAGSARQRTSRALRKWPTGVYAGLVSDQGCRAGRCRRGAASTRRARARACGSNSSSTIRATRPGSTAAGSSSSTRPSLQAGGGAPAAGAGRAALAQRLSALFAAKPFGPACLSTVVRSAAAARFMNAPLISQEVCPC